MGTWEHWGEPYANDSLFISLLLSNFIKKKYFHENMGTLGTFANFQVQIPNTKIVILSEACTKVLHPKVLFLVQELFLHVLLAVFLQCIITQ
jgi:hypothetical protein